ncbi:MAG: hypothetical protein ACQEQO_04090, partial [Thermodesulfobacteriota bacterium]
TNWNGRYHIPNSGDDTFNPDYAVATYCGLKNLAATLFSRFCFSTYLQICLRRKIAPTSRFAEVFQPS